MGPGHDCLLSSGLWEMTQFDMSSVNRYSVVAEVTTEHAQRQPAEVPTGECQSRSLLIAPIGKDRHAANWCVLDKYSLTTHLSLHFTYYSTNCTFYLQWIHVFRIILTINTWLFSLKKTLNSWTSVMWKKSLYCAVRVTLHDVLFRRISGFRRV